MYKHALILTSTALACKICQLTLATTQEIMHDGTTEDPELTGFFFNLETDGVASESDPTSPFHTYSSPRQFVISDHQSSSSPPLFLFRFASSSSRALVFPTGPLAETL